MKKLIASVLMALGMSGAVAALVPAPAHALPLCVRVNVTIFGNRVGTGSEFISIPPGGPCPGDVVA